MATTKTKPAAKRKAAAKPAPAKRTTGTSGSSAANTTSSATTEAAAPRKKAAWPARGYDGPPPWQLAHDHLHDHREHRERVGLKLDDDTGQLVRAPGLRPEPYRGPGAVTHSMPILTQGVADASYPTPVVSELARRLQLLGYEDNTLAQGQNAAGVFDASLWGSVVQFQRDHGIRENEASFAGGTVPAQDLVDRHVGPYTWQALIELSDQAEAEREASWQR